MTFSVKSKTPQANLFVIAAPSGAGKTSLVKELVSSPHLGLQVAISYTTRPPRPGDEDGVDYHFVSTADFEQMIADGHFLEYANVFGHFYGTSKSWVEQKLAQGQDIILEIDWQGARQIHHDFSGQAVLIFILPPSMQVLQQRLQTRKQDTVEVVSKRLEGAKCEIEHCQEFDYLIVNDDFAAAVAQLSFIVQSARLGVKRQLVQHQALLSELLL